MAKRWYLLRYQYVPDAAARRPALRPDHLRLAEEWSARGLLALGGATESMAFGLLVFRSTEREVRDFVALDPYVQAAQNERIVESYTIDVWNVVVGSLARD